MVPRPPGSTLFPYTTLFRSTNASGRLFDAQGDGTIINEFSGAGGSFNNAGTFRKSAGAGTLSLANGGYGLGINNAGTVVAVSGPLQPSTPGTHTGDFHLATGAGLTIN